MAAPASAPTGLVAISDAPGAGSASWNPVAGATGYRLNVSDSAGFLVSTQVYSDSYTSASFLLPLSVINRGSTMYIKVQAFNADGTGPDSAAVAVSTLPTTMFSQLVNASVSIPDTGEVTGSLTVELRSDGATMVQTVQLGYLTPNPVAFNVIATLNAGDLPRLNSDRSASLVADPDGNLYVITIATIAGTANRIRVQRFLRTGQHSWTLSGDLSGDITALAVPQPIYRIAAAWAPGPTPGIVLAYTRIGSAGNPTGVAVVNPAAVAASAGSLFFSVNNSPSYLPPADFTINGQYKALDLVPRPGSSNQFVVIANGLSIIQVDGGTVSGVAKFANTVELPVVDPYWDKVLIAIDSTRVAILSSYPAADLYVSVYSLASGGITAQGYVAASEFQGATNARQWDAYFDRASSLLRIYAIGSAGGARTLKRYDINVDALSGTAVGSGTVVTAALGAGGSTNKNIRIPRFPDERRVRVGASNLNAGVKAIAGYDDTAGNLTPGAPAPVDVPGFDATQAYTLQWVNGDANPLEVFTAYELQVQRVSDSVNVVNTGKVAATNPVSRVITAATLTNAVAYRWRVRVWDGNDVVSAWSSYDDFTTAAIGTLTITAPVADTAGLDVATYNVQWSYAQVNGYVQTQRRVRVIRVSDGAVLSDTTMQASAVQNYTVSLPTGVPVRIEVSIVTNAPSTPTVTANRLVTTNYLLPMTPTVVVTTNSVHIRTVVTNPAPTGSRPAADSNLIQRKVTGSGDSAYINVGRCASGGTFDDYSAASGVAYTYRAVAMAADGSSSPGLGDDADPLSLIGAWAHDPENPLGTIADYPHVDTRSESNEVAEGEHPAAGRTNPLVEYGETEWVKLALSITIPWGSNHDARVAFWRTRITDRKPLVYRDNRGRVLVGCIRGGVKINDIRIGTVIDVALQRVDYDPVV